MKTQWERDRDEWMRLRQLAAYYRERGSQYLADTLECQAVTQFWKWHDRARNSPLTGPGRKVG